MSDISGQARLGKNPELKYIGQDENKQAVCELRVRMLNPKQDKKTDEWIDRGFWAQVNLWGPFAEAASKLLQKGDRVFVANGTLAQDTWFDENNPDKENAMMKIDTNMVFPYTTDIESIKYKPRKSGESESDADTNSSTDADMAMNG